MLELFRAMEQVAASETSVHIFGETGTGKERIARALHDHSARARGPFVPLNASSLSDEMFEAEVFGHVKGAFTGAVADRKGFVAEAEGGTLFLDEVTDLSPRAQAKLLRFLQEREYRRVGESHLRKANVRLLTASNITFDERVAGGHFRSDLVYRLNTVTLRLPPLRERGDDIRVLAQHFLREKARQLGRPVPSLSSTIVSLLEKHRWPGNVRELANTMERLVTFARAGALPPELIAQALEKPRGRVAGSLREAQWAFERDFVSRALSGNAGNKARTAAAIGISRQALLQKIQRLGL
jgi:DNA-binding NtrC family response regulator